MSDSLLQVSVVATSGMIWSGEASHVQIPASDGLLGILPKRQPLLAELVPGKVKVDSPQGVQDIPVLGGFVSVDMDKVTVLCVQTDGDT